MVPFPAGGSNDVVARLLGTRLSQFWGQTVVIDNRGGGGGNIGAEAVARAPADGYTLLLAAPGPLVVNQSLYSKLSFNPAQDFTPIALIASVPIVLAVNPGVKATTVSELIALAKASPGKLNFGSSGLGSTNHLAGELLKARAGIDIVHVPYRGAAPAMNDLISGEMPMMFDNMPAVRPQVQGGKIRALAVAGAARSPLFPELPTMVEAGVANFEASSWFGLVAPAKTPPECHEGADRDGQQGDGGARHGEAAGRCRRRARQVVRRCVWRLPAHRGRQMGRGGEDLRRQGRVSGTEDRGKEESADEETGVTGRAEVPLRIHDRLHAAQNRKTARTRHARRSGLVTALEDWRIAALTPDALDQKTVQLMAFAILLVQTSEAAANHAKAAIKAGATLEELHASAGIAALFRGVAAFNMAGEILRGAVSGRRPRTGFGRPGRSPGRVSEANASVGAGEARRLLSTCGRDQQ